MKPVLIILTGHAPASIRARHGDFPAWLRHAARLAPTSVRVVNVAADEVLPAAGDVAGAIISGSGAMVTERLRWSELTAGWIRGAMDAGLPLFGVCFGHQLMAHALGGRVDYLPGGREIGTQSVTLLPGATDVACSRLPPAFRAHTTHEQSVLETPPGCIVLARSVQDPHQMVRYGEHAISTQFHPEFSAEVMRAYVQRKQSVTRHAAVRQLPEFRAVGPTPVARSVLWQFARRQSWAGAA